MPTIQPSNHPTIQPSNHPSNHPLIQEFFSCLFLFDFMGVDDPRN
ncbi:MAG TPA: hypothetical protein DCL77_02525 [Prolixibacteraceae bacterium]|nr:hypothetical protein [Prolixibacteraceae bacterium]